MRVVRESEHAGVCRPYGSYHKRKGTAHMTSNMLTQSRLKELLHYDPETGVFTRRVDVTYNARAGDVAGTQMTVGYLSVGLDGCRYSCHRLAWLYMHGVWPSTHIDHIDGVRTNNRIVNLREANDAQNHQNRRAARKDSKSGLLGVSWHQHSRGWAACITTGGKSRHLGVFDTPELAHEAYLRAKHALHEFSTLEHPGGETYTLAPERVYTSSHRGVSFDKNTLQWRARIEVSGKSIWLGRHNTEEIAYQAVLAAKAKLEATIEHT